MNLSVTVTDNFIYLNHKSGFNQIAAVLANAPLSRDCSATHEYKCFDSFGYVFRRSYTTASHLTIDFHHVPKKVCVTCNILLLSSFLCCPSCQLNQHLKDGLCQQLLQLNEVSILGPDGSSTTGEEGVDGDMEQQVQDHVTA